MSRSAQDLQQLRGVGPTLAKRLLEAGFDSLEKIAQAPEEELLKVRGITTRATGSILEQAKLLSRAPQPGQPEGDFDLQRQLSEVRQRIEAVALAARDRFSRELSGKRGKKLGADLVRIEDALLKLGGGGKKRGRARKALTKAGKRVAGLEDAGLKKLRKGLKRARKALVKAQK